MLSRTGRPLARILFGPVARIFVRIGISANTVTVLGTLLTVVAVLTFFPLGYLRTGTVVAAVLVIFDNLDGQIARSTHTDSKWGAFLDSTMDRIADAAVNAGILIWAYLWADAGCRHSGGAHFRIGCALRPCAGRSRGDECRDRDCRARRQTGFHRYLRFFGRMRTE